MITWLPGQYLVALLADYSLVSMIDYLALLAEWFPAQYDR